MLRLATWIRECDGACFDDFFRSHPEISVEDARVRPVDLTGVSGVLITGGPDVSAGFHTEPPHDLSLIHDAEPERDAWEFAAVRHALERGLPLLAICKGIQIVNLALGGTLHLDIPLHDLPETEKHNVQPLRHTSSARHRFPLVNSSHHQALNRVADDLEVEAWHVGDEIIEQVRVRTLPWGLGVQYHPERDLLYAPLFEDFFAQLQPA